LAVHTASQPGRVEALDVWLIKADRLNSPAQGLNPVDLSKAGKKYS